MNINQLPDDVYYHIWGFVPWYERLRCERVCKTWATTIPYNDVTRIAIEDVMDLYHLVDISSPEKYATLMREILKRAGPRLRTVDLRTSIRRHIPKEVMEAISVYCTELEILCLDSSKFEVGTLPVVESIHTLEAHFDQLVSETGDTVVESESNSDSSYDVYPLLVASELFSSLIASMPNLKSLTLLLNTGLRVWLRCPNLNDCVIYSRQFEANQMRVLFQNCRVLRKLHLMNARIRNLYDLLVMEHLTELHLYNLPVTDGDLHILFECCPNVENLLIRDCDKHLTFTMLGALKKLRVLDISQKQQFCFDRIIDTVAPECSLESLSYSGLLVTDECVAKILARKWHRTLTSLHITSGCLSGRNQLTSTGLTTLLVACEDRLRRLSLFGCAADDAVFHAVLDYAPSLEFIDLTRTRITETGLLHFALLRAKRLLAKERERNFHASVYLGESGGDAAADASDDLVNDNRASEPVLEVCFGARQISGSDQTKREELFRGLREVSKIVVS